MDSIQIYAAAIGGILLLLLAQSMIRQLGYRIMFLSRLARFFAHITQRPWFFFLKHFVYSFILKRKTFIGPISRSEFIAQLIYWGGTATCNMFKVTTTSAAGTRAGQLAVVNLALLFFGRRFELLSDLLGIQSATYRRIHQTVGLMTCLQGSVHALLNIRRAISTSYELGSPKAEVDNTAGSSWYGSDFLHSSNESMLCVYYKTPFYLEHLCVGDALASLTGEKYFIVALRNVSASRIGCRAEILRSRDKSAAQIMILLNRPFKVRAGMSLHIWIPGLGIRSFFGSHSFPIAWWENDMQGRAKVISLLVKPKSGFTKRLLYSKPHQLRTFIEGPYGVPIDFLGYDRILMVATGIGIAAQLSYLKELVGMKDEKRSTRTLYVVWQVDDESNLDWVHQWMDQLLLMDRGVYMLKFGIYVPPSDNEAPTAWNSEHNRIWKIPGTINPEKIVGNWWSDNGKALITVLILQQFLQIKKFVTE
ncbi:hypothetical protein TSTA_084350 [Talaromyces stipitatus ATCC 10500]|uniref:Ferric reductase NAD binding domain-containing protein n=1 Tax=Talaromyces stipitatus (strain ATCC 10500 / CBS 375.48 / QM 6759 / NRRL 1006) TaxID=441959 RepID=B8M0A7_TALSN|nr:uncharacterized protein TSTA_084350 [Talaromyces stipitatus ATCC 10500]EED21204.1 hypothetical protein TSTA_084350 [Talaromyces stipitatus ATCC 10500]